MSSRRKGERFRLRAGCVQVEKLHQSLPQLGRTRHLSAHSSNFEMKKKDETDWNIFEIQFLIFGFDRNEQQFFLKKNKSLFVWPVPITSERAVFYPPRS